MAAGTIFLADFMPDCLATNTPGPWNHPCFLMVGPSLRPDDGLAVLLPFFFFPAILDAAGLGVALGYRVAHVELPDRRAARVGGNVGVDSVRTVHDKACRMSARRTGDRTH